MMFFIVVSLVCLSFVFDMYSPLGYDIDLSANNDTKVLSSLQTKLEDYQSQMENTNKDIWSKTVGQVNASIDSGSISEADMIKSSLRALASTGTYLDVFTTMVNAFFAALHLQASVIFWFLTSSVVIIVSMILLSTVFRQYYSL